MSSTKLSCLFCKESFEDKEQLQIHFRKHGDPKFNQNAKNTKNGSGMESQSSTEKSPEEAEVVGCDVCSEVFPTISKAITHKHKMHPDHDAKYFCPWCGKLFTMKHLYNKHIESNHSSNEDNKGSGFHCDYCDVNFFAAAAMIYHNKFFHRQDTELAAIGYSKKLKHFDEEALPIYYCPFCGEEYFNKVNLHKHMGDDHIEENQSPDDVLRCPLCEAIFYHLDAYELHLTFHSTEDLYTEENDIVKNITDFSLEAVPPLMEKVENESQEDEADINSMGIENFLQQAMNETRDNELCGDEIRQKKKKHKKHKKSKKATITLDEFLSMNTDVFGEEGLDVKVQGIVEVPSQVVAKQLIKPQNVKKRATAMQSKELEHLRKQGIVIKKKPGKITQGMRVNKTNSDAIHPTFKLPFVPPRKPAPISTTSDALKKLLNQGNSQIKIVKKSSQNNLTSESQTEKDTNEPISENDKTTSMEVENQESEAINKTAVENEAINKTAGLNDSVNDNNTVEIDRTKAIPLKWKDDLPHDDNNCEDKVRVSENNADMGIKSNSCTAMNVLKSIGQHITIKQVPNSKNVSGEGKNTTEKECTTKSECLGTKTTEENNKVVKENLSSDKESLNALKHLSNLTVKSVNQSNCNTSENSKGTTKTPDVGIDLAQPADKQETDNQRSKSLEALKNISKHITVKTPGSSPKVTNNLNDIMDAKKEWTSQEECESENNNKDNANIQVHNESVNVGVQKKTELKSLDALKKISKHITVTTQNKQTQILGDADENIDSENEDQCDFDGDDDEKETAMRFDSPKMSTKSELHNDSKTDSMSTLKNIGKHVTVKASHKTSPITDEADADSETEEFNLGEFDHEKNDCIKNIPAIDSPKNSTNLKPSPKPQQYKSIDALKNISKHITVKSPGKPPQLLESPAQNTGIAPREKEDLKPRPNEQIEQKQVNKSLDALKNISKYVTVKSVSKPSNDHASEHYDDQEDEFPLLDQPNTESLENLPVAMKTNLKSKKPEIKEAMPRNSIPRKNPGEGQIIKKTIPLDTMKQLPNITAKQFNVTKNHEQQVTSSSQSIHSGKGMYSNVQKCVRTEKRSEAIETFNIDDSEDEESNAITYQKVSKPVSELPKMKSTNALNLIKNLNNITIKSNTKQNLQESNTTNPQDMDNDNSNKVNFDKSDEPAGHKKAAFQAPLKNLGKSTVVPGYNSVNVSLKARNSNQHSPKETSISSSMSRNSKTSSKPDDQQYVKLSNTLKNISKHISIKPTKTENIVESEEFYESGQDDCDSDGFTNTNVKITEIENDCSSDDEAISTLQNRIKDTASNVIVQHPSDNSDNDDFDPSNIEDQIKAVHIKRQIPEPCTDKKLVKFVNQNPNLQSLHDLNFDEEDEYDSEDNQLANSSKKTQSRPNKIRSNSRTNQNVAICGQVNTVNKEVTMQTFKTQTVIEEITTTVTKTVRTVNQAMNQEIRATSQNYSMPQVRQKLQGNSSSQIKNFRGIPVRQPRPTMSMKIRNSVPARPGLTPVRPLNQMAANRSSAGRPQNPRMPLAIRGPNASQTPQNMGSKPITMSPNAFVTPAKRQQESMGHFSCFKKPKESLIPVADIPTISGHQSNSSPGQFKSSAMSAQSSFSSSTKVVKGNSVTSSSHMKSQASTSTEQLSKLGNVSGLRVVRTSQVEERCEVRAPKRNANALEAIERLQRQGLLIKKPRADEQSHDVHQGDEDYDDE